MDCRILRQITLKADGHLACDDSAGYGIDLGLVRAGGKWKLRDILDGPIYSHVRSSFQQGRPPWPTVCQGCDLLALGAAPNDILSHSFDLLVEPTLACELSCACCIRKSIIGKGRTEDGLDVEVFRRFIKSAALEKYRMNQVHYIGWGEPLLHPRFRELVDIAYESFPTTIQMATTTGNVDFRTSVGDGRFDHIVLSCDGTTPESYERYRKGGNFDVAMKFAADAKTYGHRDLRIEWKYILFDFNDSDEEILHAQRMADQAGVDKLLFILTNSKWKSERFMGQKASSFPLISPIATITPAAAMSAFVAEGSLSGVQTGAHGYIDRIGVSSGQFLLVEGWALGPGDTYADKIQLWIDGHLRAQSLPNLPRQDVAAARPAAVGPHCGFQFNIPSPAGRLPDSIEVRVLSRDHAASMGGELNWLKVGSMLDVRKDLRVAVLESA
ncbi:radical SAM protein [Rhizobium sp. NFR03]|uniref:radical SAM protein n=1 Tax=Rhizobium sp. NFR03 TaxID=1566263 RepID=UPI0008AE02C9|nr:radical SAM protein [Rhizobium sp. NFR03]SES38192.1 Radical SAM superfamily protein [Rhizobium sp. NFR03]